MASGFGVGKGPRPVAETRATPLDCGDCGANTELAAVAGVGMDKRA